MESVQELPEVNSLKAMGTLVGYAVLDMPFPQRGAESGVGSLDSHTLTAPGSRERPTTWVLPMLAGGHCEWDENGCGPQEEGLGQQTWSHVHTHRTSGVRLRPMVSQEAQLAQGRDFYWDHLGGLRAMGEMSVGHQPEPGILIQARQTNPKMVRLCRGKNRKRLTRAITPHY